MKYLYKFNENMSMAKSIVSKKMEAFDKLKDLLSKNLGYIGKFTQYLMEENVPYNELEELYKNLKNLKDKNINLDISNLKYEQVIDSIQNSENDLNVNSLINQFPSIQKNLAKELKKNSSIYNALLKISKKENKDAFISKISRYKTEEELKNAIKIFSKDSNNDISFIKDYISKSETASIEFEKDNILIVLIKDIKDVKALGADTSWCILREYNWNSYTKNRLQYILFDFNKPDFDPEFKIGFTLEYNGSIYTAHDILDHTATNSLKTIFNELNLDIIEFTKKHLESKNKEYTKKLAETKFNAKTAISLWKDLVDSTPQSELENLLIKFMDIHKMTFNPSRKSVDHNLTDNRMEVVHKLIRKMGNQEFIKEDEIEDERIKYYINANNKLLKKDTINSNFKEADIIEHFDYFTTGAFLKYIEDLTFNIFSSSFFDGERKLKVDIKFLERIYERVKDEIDLTKSEKLAKNYAFLSKLLGKNEYQEYIDINQIAKHNNYFKEEIDLDKLDSYNISSLVIKNFDWASYIVKKDYTIKIYNPIIIDAIFEHLKDYNVTIDTFSRYSEFRRSLNNKPIINNFLKNLPTTSTKKVHTNEKGNHKLIFK